MALLALDRYSQPVLWKMVDVLAIIVALGLVVDARPRRDLVQALEAPSEQVAEGSGLRSLLALLIRRRTPRPDRAPSRSARDLVEVERLLGQRHQPEPLARLVGDPESPSGSSGSRSRSSASVVFESARFQRTSRSVSARRPPGKLLQQRLDLPQEVRLLVPEVVQVGVECVVEEPHFGVVELEGVHGEEAYPRPRRASPVAPRIACGAPRRSSAPGSAAASAAA